MKVLHYGKITPSTASCPHCECIISYLPKDVTHHFDGRDRVYGVIECPVCETEIIVP